MSSPITSQSSPNLDKSVSRLPDSNLLTPPASPPRRAGSSNDLRIDFESLETLRSSADTSRTQTYTEDGIVKCPFETNTAISSDGEPYTFGHGAWSNVYKATCRDTPTSNSGLLTPPLRPIRSIPSLVAIKSPARRDAIPILREEGKTLSHLKACDPYENYIVTFHGIIDESSSLVMAAYPLSLEDHIKACAQIARKSQTISNMKQPVLGSTKIWLSLASKLIKALDWMHHEASTVHGDIKPGNILLRPVLGAAEDEFPFAPLFIDFSSSQRLDSSTIVPNTLSAITTEYTAPELLSVAVLNNPRSCATVESDIFSLAVTLLAAATGDTLIYGGCSTQQKLMLAKQGAYIIANVRSLSYRVPRHGTVSRILEKAVVKKDVGRISTSDWLRLVAELDHETQDDTSRL